MAIYDVNAAIQKPSIVNAMQQGFMFGSQQRQMREQQQREEKINALAPGAISGDPKAYAEVAAIDPQRAQQFSQAGDVNLRKMKGAVEFINRARQSGNPQAVNAALRAAKPYLSQYANGAQIPDEWTPEMEQGWPGFEAKVAMLGGATQADEPAGYRQAHLMAVAAGYQPGTEEYKKAMQIGVGMAPRAIPAGYGLVEEYDPNTGRTTQRLVQMRGFENQPQQGGMPPQAGMPQGMPSGPQPSAQAPAGDGMAAPTGPVTAQSAEQIVAQIEQAQGAPLAPEVRQQIIADVQRNGGRVDTGSIVAGRAQPAPAVNRPLPSINDVGGGIPGFNAQDPRNQRFVTGPSREEKAAETRLMASEGAQGRIEGEKASGPDFEQESSLRKEYQAAVSPQKEIVQAYQRVEGAAKNPSAAGDLSMVFAYMKMLDPGSAVREGEFANAQNAAGIPDQVVNLYNRALSGTRLNPAQRADFLAQAGELRDQAQIRIEEATNYYRDLAPEYGIDPRRIIRGESKASEQKETYAVGDIIEANGIQYRVIGGDPADPELEEL